MVDGLDLDALAAFLRSPGAVADPADLPTGPQHAELNAGGKSNLTGSPTTSTTGWCAVRRWATSSPPPTT